MSYFLWEWKKIWRKSFALPFLFVMAILVSGHYAINYESSNPLIENSTEWWTLPSDIVSIDGSGEEIIPQADQETMFFFNETMRQKESGEYTEADERLIDLTVDAIRNHQYQLQSSGIAYHAGLPDWLTNIVEHHLTNFMIRDGGGWSYIVSDETKQAGISQLEYLKAHKIEPRKPLLFQRSAVDHRETQEMVKQLFGEEQEFARVYTDYRPYYTDKGWYYLWDMIREQNHLLILAGLMILFGGILASEKHQHLNHYPLLLLDGVSLTHHFNVKFLIAFLSSIIFFFVSILVIVFAGLLTKGLGSLDYPVLYHFYSNDANFWSKLTTHFLHDPHVSVGTQLGLSSISLGQYLGHSVLLLISMIFFTLSLTFFLANFLKHELVVGLMGVGVIGVSQFLPISALNPFTYFDIDGVVSGGIRIYTEDNSISFLMGMTVLIISGIILYILSHYFQYRQQPERISFEEGSHDHSNI